MVVENFAFAQLPIDIIHHILSYTDTIKLRNGKYMNQISKTDVRYELLQEIPAFETINYGDGIFMNNVYFTKYNCGSEQLRFHYNIKLRRIIYQYYCVLNTERPFIQLHSNY
jgi:hypothetical protein